MGINVLQLTLSFRQGGRKNTIKTLTRGLNATGTRCDLCCLDELGCDPAELTDLFRSVTVMGRGRAGYRDRVRHLRTLCREREIDLIHAHDGASQFLGSLVRLVRPRVRLVMMFHRSLGFESARRRDRLRNAASGWLTQAVVTGSSERRSHYLHSLRERFAARSRDVATREYSSSLFARRYLDLYQRVLARRASPVGHSRREFGFGADVPQTLLMDEPPVPIRE